MNFDTVSCKHGNFDGKNIKVTTLGSL